jgi:uncharacterized membrane protein YraQ (UPF0718 family)
MWSLTQAMAPYLLFGFAVSGILAVFISPQLVERHLGGRGPWPVIKAALFGVPLPLCSCGVIPVAASLRKHGSSKGATLSFLLSTPETGVDSILVTYSLLGPVFAIFRPIAAFAMGITGGIAADRLDPDRPRSGAETQPVGCNESCCATDGGKQNRLRRAMRHGFIVLPRDLAAPILVGIAVGGVISALLPEDFFANYLGTGLFSMLVMMAASIPVYVCASASVPVAAAMMLKGLSPGAALVFLIAGPATNASAVTALLKILGPRSMAVYLATIGVLSLVFGYLINAIAQTTSLPMVSGNADCHAGAEGGWFSAAAAIVLLALFAFARVTVAWRKSADPD